MQATESKSSDLTNPNEAFRDYGYAGDDGVSHFYEDAMRNGKREYLIGSSA